MKDSSALRNEATEWFLAIRETQDPSPDVLQKWLNWLDASEENRRAFEELAQVWHGVTPAIIARPAADLSQDDYDGSMTIAEWRARKARGEPSPQPSPASGRGSASLPPLPPGERAGVSGPSSPPPPSGERVGVRGSSFQPRRLLRPLIATALAATIGVAAWLAQDYIRVLTGPKPVSSGTFATRTGEHMDLLLADGSRVTLGGHSQVVVDFTPALREVRLDAGEAFFSVRRDPEREFRVLALDGAITAIGTAFNVRAVADRVTVTVTEGTVRVGEIGPTRGAASAESAQEDFEGEPAGTSELQLARGEQLTYRPDTKSKTLEVTPIRHVDADESARWREGWLVYRDEPLRYVIADIRRYSDINLAVAESAAYLRFSGAVFKDRVAEWIVALPEVSPVMIETQGDRLTIKTRPPGIIVQH